MFTVIQRLLHAHGMLFSTFARQMIEEAQREGGYSRAANYVTALRSLTSVIGEIRLSKLTAKEIGTYQQRLTAQGLSMNTISCYNRSLRAIYNKAVEQHLIPNRMPFEEAFTGKMRTVKRSISEEHIHQLKMLQLAEDSQLMRVRDYFLFSFYAMGMPFVDMAYLRMKQIHGDVLAYRRHKTGQLVQVPLTEEAMNILRRYHVPSSPYAFPILTSTEACEAYHEYCTQLTHYNRALKQLAALAGLQDTLSSYTVRHSWASIAYKSNVPLNIIAQALGHANTNVTMTYIRELDADSLRKENERVLARIE